MRKSVFRWAVFVGLVLIGIGLFPMFMSRGAQSEPGGGLSLDLGNKMTMKLARIPSGKFKMGSDERQNGHEYPEFRHEVTISKPFFMGITPVTVDQFAAFVKNTGYKTDAEKEGWANAMTVVEGVTFPRRTGGLSWRKTSFKQKGDHPVVNVSWNDAQAFCKWLSTKSGKAVHLPTEAQWEYACRANTQTAYPWGDNPNDGKGWANGADQSYKKLFPDPPGSTWDFFAWDDGFVFTSPVGNFKANNLGLYDMIGNVWEWCSDGYGFYEKVPVKDPTGSPEGKGGITIRVLRGGSWSCLPEGCRSASRFHCYPTGRSEDFGFRVVVWATVP